MWILTVLFMLMITNTHTGNNSEYNPLTDPFVRDLLTNPPESTPSSLAASAAPFHQLETYDDEYDPFKDPLYDPLKDPLIEPIIKNLLVNPSASNPPELAASAAPFHQLATVASTAQTQVKDNSIVLPPDKQLSSKEPQKENAKRKRKCNKRERKYPCSLCCKKFTAPSQAKRHEATHTKTTFFACRICGKECTEKHNVVIHLQGEQHKETLVSALQEKGYELSEMETATEDKPLLASLFVRDLIKEPKKL